MSSFLRPQAVAYDENARFAAKPAAQAVDSRQAFVARRALGDAGNTNVAPALPGRVASKSGFAPIIAPQAAALPAGAGVEAGRIERAGHFAADVYQPPELPAFDKADLSEPHFAADYVGTIYSYFRSVESAKHANYGYMLHQQDINEKMRAILIDWLVEVHAKFKLMPETMYLTVNIIDRYLELKPAARTKLQLIGVTAMLLASKYEEIYAPVVRDFVYITDKAYTKEQILQMEASMLNTLSFRITVPTAWNFVNRFLKVANVTAAPLPEKSDADLKCRNYAYFLLERTLQEYSMLKFAPSRIAAAAVNIMLRSTRGPGAWDMQMVQNTGYTQEDLREPVLMMQQSLDTHRQDVSPPNNLKAVYKKYSLPKHSSVSFIPFAPLD